MKRMPHRANASRYLPLLSVLLMLGCQPAGETSAEETTAAETSTTRNLMRIDATADGTPCVEQAKRSEEDVVLGGEACCQAVGGSLVAYQRVAGERFGMSCTKSWAASCGRYSGSSSGSNAPICAL